MLLEEKGADIYTKGRSKESLLFTAIENNKLNILIYLSPKFNHREKDDNGFTPLLFSVVNEWDKKK